MKRTSNPAVRKAETTLREYALALPESHEEFPWGHTAIKVRGKIFLFLGGGSDGGLSLSVKLKDSNTAALDQPFATPTHYGMGKHGWVSAQFAPGENPPIELLQSWIDESYRAIAPKKLVASLGGGGRRSASASTSASRAEAADDAPARKKAPSTRRADAKGAKAAKGASRKKPAARSTRKKSPSTAARKRARR